MIGTTFNQRFLLEKELGRGGMGAVYRATDQVLGRAVAIKVLKEQGGAEVGKKIRLEAQILARLLHENIVRIYDFGESEGVYFLVMEEVDGTSYLKRWKQVPLVDRLTMTAQVAEALDYAHRQGVIHRDVKPANVLLTATDRAKLSDFGLSMIAEQSDETQTIRGTPTYMSPEQARGKALDFRTDLYSLGVMLYECAVGTVPFQGKSLAVIAQHATGTPDPPRARNPEVAPSLEALILKLLSKDPAQRPASGAAVAEALRREIDAGRSRLDAPTEVVTGLARDPAAALLKTEPMAAPRPVVPPAPALPATTAPRAAPPLARAMLEEILATPVALSADERYLCGHYLAYLLGGSRRRGFFLRRPLDPRNADRARLLLAMTSIMLADASEASIARAAELLETRPDVRPSLNPIVVAKYLAHREPGPRRKRFRQARKLLLDASPYARKHMTSPNGVLNPGLMPQTLDDLRTLAPERTEIDDQLVSRWNRVAEVWRDNKDFRTAVLRYATKDAARDPASADLWPEVVYPLIERVRWQRKVRSGTEALWDYVCAKVLHVPDAGVRLDREIRVAIPAQVVDDLDLEIEAFDDEPALALDEPTGGLAGDPSERAGSGIMPTVRVRHDVLDELAADRPEGDKDLVRLSSPDPVRFVKGDLQALWREAVAARKDPGATAAHRTVPVGPYRLAVIASVRGRSAGQVAIQGMRNKQIELLTPSLRIGGSGSKPYIAVWVYRDQSLVVSFLDFKNSASYILWHAPNAQQFNFGDPGELNHMLLNLGMEAPDQLDRALSNRFRPRNPV